MSSPFVLLLRIFGIIPVAEKMYYVEGVSLGMYVTMYLFMII